MALDSMQPVGDLCDLLGVSRRSPGVFDAMVEILYGGSSQAETRCDQRLAVLARRVNARR